VIVEADPRSGAARAFGSLAERFMSTAGYAVPSTAKTAEPATRNGARRAFSRKAG
jgi:hypothetical protein